MRVKRKTLVRAAAFLLCAVLLLGPMAQPAFATSESSSKPSREEYDELRKQADALKDQISALNDSIENNRATAQQKQNEQALVQQKAAAVEEQINLQLQKIDLQEAYIEAKQLEIVQKQKDYDDNHELFVERLVAIYKMNNASVLSTLLTVDSYTEMLTIATNLQVISQHDTEMLQDLENQRIALEAERVELEAMLAELEAERDELSAMLQDYQNTVSRLGQEASNAIAQAAADEKEAERLAEERERVEAEMEEIWKSLAASTGEYVGGYLEWPVPGYNGDAYISSHFGYRTLYGRSNFHTGTDINKGPQASIAGTGIVAANAGTVILVSTNNASGGYGYYLIIDHGGGVRTLYAHCSSISVSVGQAVSRGQTIATVGNTGNSTGPHLHFELRVNNTEKVNAYPYLTGQISL